MTGPNVEITVKVPRERYIDALRSRRADLEAELASEEEIAYKAYVAWRSQVADWLAEQASRIRGATTASLSSHVRTKTWGRERVSWEGLLGTQGAPEPPDLVSDTAATIRRVEAMLAQLSLSAQPTVSVRTADVEAIGLRLALPQEVTR